MTKTIFIALSLMFAVFWALNSGQVLMAKFKNASKEGVGYFNKPSLRKIYFPLINFMENHYSGEKIYSDNAVLFYALTGLRFKDSSLIKEKERSFYLILFKEKKISHHLRKVLENYDKSQFVAFDCADVYFLKKIEFEEQQELII